ncbi:protein disulfide-isomerase A5 [Onthophagus taurus]|uniref:protein disulfide-isomerase A5 n=1 Tax=Onthophagus taurus TaxID=166361 RepID=UPI0039BE4990
MKSLYLSFILLLIYFIPNNAKTNNKNVVIENVSDIKDFKKVVRTKTNLLVCFVSSLKKASDIVKVVREAAFTVKGQGTMMLVDCSSEARKLCKKLKVSPDPSILKHYKDGEYHKDYDRKGTVSSMVNFMRDPAGDIPWEEDSSANHVVHISDAQSLAKFIRKETKPILIMFYAPWCGFCKSLKPEYSAAATELQGEAYLAAIDVNRPENSGVRAQYNITGFPTLLYYESGVVKYQYEGENNKVGIVAFMRSPSAPTTKLKDPEWSDSDSDVVHLTANNFDPVIREEASVLIMFYAPWCGHCQRLKPEYEKAAAQMKTDGIPGMLAAIDANKEQSIATRFDIRGFPTIKYFVYGEVKFDVNVRDAPKIIAFMSNPSEPPVPPPAEIPWADDTKTNVVHLNEDTFKPFLKKKKHVLVMFYTPWCGHCKKAKPEFEKAAEKFRDDPKVEFAAVDCTTQQSLCSAQDIKGYPTIRYFSYLKFEKPYSGARTAQDFEKFMRDPEAAKPPQSMPKPKSEQWRKETTTAILHLTDNNFKREIAKGSPVLVMFYAPWCGHCNKMKSDYNKAAEDMKKEGFQGSFAMFDCTENPEITEEFQISGFPTIKLFVGGKYVKDYRGTRTMEDLKTFMKTSNIRDRQEL